MKTYDELLAERDALASVVETLRQVDRDYKDNNILRYEFANKVMAAINSAPQQCLADIKAEAGEVAYYNGFKDALVIEPPLPSATGTSGAIDFFAYRIEQASRYAANQYAAKIRNTGTWLKDSNVNGGKRQGGE